jgi:hypothetical protein
MKQKTLVGNMAGGGAGNARSYLLLAQEFRYVRMGNLTTIQEAAITASRRTNRPSQGRGNGIGVKNVKAWEQL